VTQLVAHPLFTPHRNNRKLLKIMAEPTGLEPATSDVTGRRSNQLNYDSAKETLCVKTWWARRDSNPQPLPCKGSRLPLTYVPISICRFARLRSRKGSSQSDTDTLFHQNPPSSCISKAKSNAKISVRHCQVSISLTAYHFCEHISHLNNLSCGGGKFSRTKASVKRLCRVRLRQK
jgi:hypothetical protein